ncbi:hypothetical protein EV401DRAFT_2001474, partial [Pisolithus croceorrhizus]
MVGSEGFHQMFVWISADALACTLHVGALTVCEQCCGLFGWIFTECSHMHFMNLLICTLCVGAVTGMIFWH